MEITFRLYQQNKISDPNVKFRQASNRCKRVLQAATLAYASKVKESITSQKPGSGDFWPIGNSVLSKDKSKYTSSIQRCSASDKTKLCAKNFFGYLFT